MTQHTQCIILKDLFFRSLGLNNRNLQQRATGELQFTEQEETSVREEKQVNPRCQRNTEDLEIWIELDSYLDFQVKLAAEKAAGQSFPGDKKMVLGEQAGDFADK